MGRTERQRHRQTDRENAFGGKELHDHKCVRVFECECICPLVCVDECVHARMRTWKRTTEKYGGKHGYSKRETRWGCSARRVGGGRKRNVQSQRQRQRDGLRHIYILR